MAEQVGSSAATCERHTGEPMPCGHCAMDAMGDDKEDRTSALEDRIVAALNGAWDQQCSGHKNPDVCESCRAYEDAIFTTRWVAARLRDGRDS